MNAISFSRAVTKHGGAAAAAEAQVERPMVRRGRTDSGLQPFAARKKHCLDARAAENRPPGPDRTFVKCLALQGYLSGSGF